MLHILMNHLLTKVTPRFEQPGTYGGAENSLEASLIDTLAKQPNTAQSPDAFVQVFEAMQGTAPQQVQAELVQVQKQELIKPTGPEPVHSDEIVASEHEKSIRDFEMSAESSQQASQSQTSSSRQLSWQQGDSAHASASRKSLKKSEVTATEGERVVLGDVEVLKTDSLDQGLPSVLPNQKHWHTLPTKAVATDHHTTARGSALQSLLPINAAQQLIEPPEPLATDNTGTDAARPVNVRTRLATETQVAVPSVAQINVPANVFAESTRKTPFGLNNERQAAEAPVRLERPLQSKLALDDKKITREINSDTQRLVLPTKAGTPPFEQTRSASSAMLAPKADGRNSTDLRPSDSTHVDKAQHGHMSDGPKANRQDVFEAPSKAVELDRSAYFDTRNSPKTTLDPLRASTVATPSATSNTADRTMLPSNLAKFAGDASPDNPSLFLTTASVESPSPTRSSILPHFHAPEMPRHVSQQIAIAVHSGSDSSVEIVLKPAELGRVQISLTTSETGIVVNVAAERPETMELLRRNIDQLANEFRDIGYGHSEFRFDRGASGQGHTKDDQGDFYSDATVEQQGHGPMLTDQDIGNIPPHARIDLDRVDIRI